MPPTNDAIAPAAPPAAGGGGGLDWMKVARPRTGSSSSAVPSTRPRSGSSSSAVPADSRHSRSAALHRHEEQKAHFQRHKHLRGLEVERMRTRELPRQLLLSFCMLVTCCAVTGIVVLAFAAESNQIATAIFVEDRLQFKWPESWGWTSRVEGALGEFVAPLGTPVDVFTLILVIVLLLTLVCALGRCVWPVLVYVAPAQLLSPRRPTDGDEGGYFNAALAALGLTASSAPPKPKVERTTVTATERLADDFVKISAMRGLKQAGSSLIELMTSDADMPELLRARIGRLTRWAWNEWERELLAGILLENTYYAQLKRRAELRRIRQAMSPLPWWPSPYRKVRAAVLYTLYPYDRSFWAQIKLWLYWPLMACFLCPVYGVQPMTFLALFLFRDKHDEYQLTQFILEFKGFQFLSATMSGLIGGVRIEYCAAHDTCEHMSSRGAPGMYYGFMWENVAFTLNVLLVWGAFLLLPFSRQKGALGAVLEQEERQRLVKAATIEEQRERSAARAEAQPEPRRWARKSPARAAEPAPPQPEPRRWGRKSPARAAEPAPPQPEPRRWGRKSLNHAGTAPDLERGGGSSEHRRSTETGGRGSVAVAGGKPEQNASSQHRRAGADRPADGRKGGGYQRGETRLLLEEIAHDRDTCFGWLTYTLQRGGALRPMLAYDLVCFMLAGILALHALVTTSGWRQRSLLYWARVLYGMLALPFLPFVVPPLDRILVHAKSTAYNLHGKTMPLLSMRDRQYLAAMVEQDRATAAASQPTQTGAVATTAPASGSNGMRKRPDQASSGASAPPHHRATLQ